MGYDSNKPLRIILISLCVMMFSCDEAKYELDNPYDPENMDLEPPALFFHPTNINVGVGDTIEINLYSYKMDPTAAAYLKIKYDRTIVKLGPDTVVADDYFQGDNEPFLYWEEETESYLEIFLYYLPDMNSDQSSGGTWSLAKIQFIAEQPGEFELKYITEADSEDEEGPYTELRNANNNTLNIKDYGKGLISVE